MKFDSVLAMPLPVHLLNFKSNWHRSCSKDVEFPKPNGNYFDPLWCQPDPGCMNPDEPPSVTPLSTELLGGGD